jgi:hypothetical protein
VAKKRKRKASPKKAMAKYYADLNRAVKKLLKKKAQLERQ